MTPPLDPIYKFRCFGDPNHQKLVSDNEVWFAAPNSFNDPFDCNIPIRTDLLPREEQVALFATVAKSRNSELNAEQAQELALAEIEQSRNPLRRHEIQTEIRDEVFSPGTGVLSLATSVDDSHATLVWSHYSDSHKGFAVGLRQEVLLQWAMNVSGFPDGNTRGKAVRGLQVRPLEVQYPNEMPVLIPREGNDAAIILGLIENKSCVWRYEAEVRYLMMKFDDDGRPASLTTKDRAQRLPPDAILDVTLGAHCEPDDRLVMIDLLRKRGDNLPLYQAVPRQDSFSIERVRLTY